MQDGSNSLLVLDQMALMILNAGSPLLGVRYTRAVPPVRVWF